MPFQFDKHSATLKHDTTYPGPGVDQPPNDLAGENLPRASNATPSCVLSQSLDAEMPQQRDWTKQAMHGDANYAFGLLVPSLPFNAPKSSQI